MRHVIFCVCFLLIGFWFLPPTVAFAQSKFIVGDPEPLKPEITDPIPEPITYPIFSTPEPLPTLNLIAIPTNLVRPEIIPIITPLPKPTQCQVSGCSGELCVDPDTDPLYSTCVWREEYACYRSAECKRQANGSCGWTQTPELQSCLGQMQPQPTPVKGVKPVCGNQLCEINEYIPCPKGTNCFWAGSCPQDCINQPTPGPKKCRPRPACLDANPKCHMVEPNDGWCPEPPKYRRFHHPLQALISFIASLR